MKICYEGSLANIKRGLTDEGNLKPFTNEVGLFFLIRTGWNKRILDSLVYTMLMQ